MPVERTDVHVTSCAPCRLWQARATGLSRSLRVRSATSVPDLTAVILEHASAPIDTRGWPPRIALSAVAVAQIGVALTQILNIGTTSAHAQHGGVPVATHLFNESTAWNLALGVGLFWAAFRPRVTSGLIPVLAGFLVVLLAYSTYDLITGVVPVARVVSHGLLVAGLCLLIVVNRSSRDPAPHGVAATADDVDRASAPSVAEPTPRDRPGGRPPLRPASRHRVA